SRCASAPRTRSCRPRPRAHRPTGRSSDRARAPRGRAPRAPLPAPRRARADDPARTSRSAAPASRFRLGRGSVRLCTLRGSSVEAIVVDALLDVVLEAEWFAVGLLADAALRDADDMIPGHDSPVTAGFGAAKLTVAQHRLDRERGEHRLGEPPPEVL